MTVCIAEKPSVAQDIAKVIGATEKHDGYFEGNGYQVTWTFGHLCCLKDPGEYHESWKRWSLSGLPMIPEEFGIKLIDNPGVRKQFSVIKKLFSAADMIVNCGDAGQEGELIQRWVMQMAKAKCPVKRLWISSLTEESIRKGFKELKPQEKYDHLYYAGMARATGDWLLGINATRLYTLKYGGQGVLLSIGRVQTPTLAMIVNRQKEIDTFRPEQYLTLTTQYRGANFQSVDGNYKDKRLGLQALEDVQAKPLVIDEVEQKKGFEAAPQLYDLTSLQVECNKRYGYSAEMTLNIIQTLYEKKLTTYPRVDTRYLSEDIYVKCQGILSGIAHFCPNVQNLLGSSLRKSKRVFDSGKVTDHHAIIPTGKRVPELPDREMKVFSLIAMRFISVFYPDCTFMATTVKAHAGAVGFKSTGKEILEPGWKKVNDSGEKEDVEQEIQILPKFVRGEQGTHTPLLSEKWTTPPKPYTEATLLRAMETAGKFVDNEELRVFLKQNGIGRPSSRAGIIETLFKRNYIRRDKKNLIPTETGISLVGTIKSELLKSCELTGLWEKKLREIEAGKYDPVIFINELKQQLRSIITTVENDTDGKRVTSATIPSKPAPLRKSSRTSKKIRVGVICPLCGKGKIFKAKYNYRCSRWNEGCSFSHPFDKK